MATNRIVLRQGQIRNFLNNPNGPVVRDLERRAQNVLERAQELCPEASGDMKNSLRIVRTTQRGKPIVRVTARVDYAKHVVLGTGGYGAPPPSARIKAWAVQKGIDPSHAYAIAKVIQRRGTWGESGNIVGNQRSDGGPRNWLTEALKEASR